MKQQGRDTSFETRRAVFNLHNLNKRLGDYRGTEAQNFALKNMMDNETLHEDTMLMKAKGKNKYDFDVPGGSVHTGTGTDPLQAQRSAVANVTNSLLGSSSVTPESLRIGGYEAFGGGLKDVRSGQMLQGIQYNPGETQILADPSLIPGILAGRGVTPQTQTPAEASGQFFASANQMGTPPAVPKLVSDALGNQVPQGQPGVNPAGLPANLLQNAQTAGAATQPDPYANLTNVNGTIYNKTTGVGYPTPEALAKDLGVAPNQIDWAKIGAGAKPGAGGQTNVSGQADTTGTSGAEDLYGLGEETPEGILAKKKAEMDKTAADTETKKDTETFQETMASAGLAFSGIRDKGEQEIAAANFAKKEQISLTLAKTILNAASAELKNQQGEIREVNDKLIQIKPDGTTTVLYEDTSALTDEQKEAIKFKALEKELELRRQSAVEQKKAEIAAGVRKAPGSGAVTFSFGKTELRTAAADQVFTEARKELVNNVGADGNYDPDIFLRNRKKLEQTSPQDLNDFDKEFAPKLNPLDRTRYGIGLGTAKADSGFSFTIDAASLTEALGGE